MAKTEEHKQKIRESNKKTWDNRPDLKKAIGETNSALKKGKPSGRKGIPNGRKGIAHSLEHAARIRESLNTPESKTKRSEAAKRALSDPKWKAEQSARLKAIWAIRKAKKEAASCL